MNRIKTDSKSDNTVFFQGGLWYSSGGISYGWRKVVVQISMF